MLFGCLQTGYGPFVPKIIFIIERENKEKQTREFEKVRMQLIEDLYNIMYVL